MPQVNGSDVTRLVIACDAGMGSSLFLASRMRQELGEYGVEVAHSPVNSIPPDAQLVLCHEGLAQRVASISSSAVIVPFSLFVGDPAFDRVERAIKDGATLES